MKSRGLQQLVERQQRARAAPPPPPARRRGRRPTTSMPERAAARAPPRGRCGRGRPRRCACRCSSTPAKDLRSHLPAFIDASACGDVAGARRAAGPAPAPRWRPGCRSGEFMTMMPRRVAASRSTLSTPTPGPADDAQVLGRVQHLGRDLAAAADGHRVVGPDDLRQLRGRHGLLHVHLPALGLQDCEAALGDAFEDEDAGSSGRAARRRARRYSASRGGHARARARSVAQPAAARSPGWPAGPRMSVAS